MNSGVLPFPWVATCKGRDSFGIWVRLLPWVLWSSLHWTFLPTPKTQGSPQSIHRLYQRQCQKEVLTTSLAEKFFCPPLGCARSMKQLPISCQTKKGSTNTSEDCEHCLSFHLKLASPCHLCSMKLLLPRPCITLELEEERQAACTKRFFCKRNWNAEKARCWPETEKR